MRNILIEKLLIEIQLEILYIVRDTLKNKLDFEILEQKQIDSITVEVEIELQIE
jgi:hypothetical protein